MFTFISVLEMIPKVNIVLLLLPTIILALDRDASCTTPNGESAKCSAVSSCQILVDAIATRESSAIDFAKKSQCGYDTEPLVCCGTHGNFVSNVWEIFTKPPEISTTTTKRTPVVSQTVANSLLPDRSICGLERDTTRVFGGEVTGIDEFPWMALLRYNYSDNTDAGFRCGGTLINNRYVLTAAHCIRTNLQNITVSSIRLGEWRVSTLEDCVEDEANIECADPVLDVPVEELVPHSYYSSRSGNNDIALIRLSQNIDYTEFIRPICLPPADFPVPPAGAVMVACGWGATENATNSDVKLKVELPLIVNSDCAKKLNDKKTRISANHVCAGGFPGKDTCQGDSGGPLMRTYADESFQNQWYQEGVVSRGRGCGRPGLPGIYIRVARYINWLLNNLRN